jgi:hypothetical protein
VKRLIDLRIKQSPGKERISKRMAEKKQGNPQIPREFPQRIKRNFLRKMKFLFVRKS